MARPVQVYDFTAFSRRTPTQQHPGDRLDAQFAEHARAIGAVQQALAEIDRKLARPLSAQPREPPLPTPALYVNAGGPYAGDDAGASATSADYAQVSIDWAEHMPDTIPPNTLAINAITGDHWSSRWWANRSANAFGMLAWWYQGAFPSPGPPSTPNTSTGQPLPVGAMYYNTTLNAMEVWNGTAWTGAANMPSPATVSSLYYSATAGQTVFPLSVVDLNGRTFAFTQTAPEGLAAHVNGLRLEIIFDFTVNVTTSTVTFLNPLSAGARVIFDLLAPLPTGVYLPLTGGTMTGALTAPSVTVNTALVGQKSGLDRWVVYLGDSEAETGTNAGSDFAIDAYSDAGAFLSNPFYITRATGNATFTAALGVDGALNVAGVVTASGGVAATGFADFSGYTETIAPVASNTAAFVLVNNARAEAGKLIWNGASGGVSLINTAAGSSFVLNADGSASVTGGFTAGGGGIVTSGGGQFHSNVSLTQSTGDYVYTLKNGGSTFVGSFGCRGSGDSAIGFFTVGGGAYNSGAVYIDDTGGDFFYSGGTGVAYKVSGTTWAAYSDERIKTVTGDYQSGLEEVLKLRPVTFVYKGNDTPAADLNANPPGDDQTPRTTATSAPYPASMHYNAAVKAQEFVGFVAQEVEMVFPDMVTEGAGFIDGQAVADLRTLDTSELIFALVNAVKQLSAKVAALEAKP